MEKVLNVFVFRVGQETEKVACTKYFLSCITVWFFDIFFCFLVVFLVVSFSTEKKRENLFYFDLFPKWKNANKCKKCSEKKC